MRDVKIDSLVNLKYNNKKYMYKHIITDEPSDETHLYIQ